MKIKQFLKEKKWSILSGLIFLFAIAVITGVLINGVNRKYNSLIDQIDRLTYIISSLEASSSDSIIDEMAQKIDELSQKPDIRTAIQSYDPELQPKIEELLKYISELNQKVESLKVTLEAEDQPTQFVEETLSATSEAIPKATAEAISETVAEDTTEIVVASVEETDTKNPPDAEIIPELTELQIPNDLNNESQNTKSIKAGDDFTITVKANEVSNLYGYQFNLNYDNTKAAFKDSLSSSVDGINTIFKKDMSDYLLIGATMIGSKPGYSGQDVTICTMVFTAVEDLDPSTFTIDGVSTVDADQKFIENIGGWSIDVKAES